MVRIIRCMLFVAVFALVPLGADTVRMAVFQLDPFMMEGDKEPDGITVEYWRRFLAPRIGVDLVVLGPFPIKRAELMLERGEVDVVSQLTRIPERERRFVYPETPLTRIASCIAVLPDSPIVAADSREAFFDKRIGFIESAYIPPFLVHPRISIDLITHQDYRRMNLNKLFAGHVDVVLDINYMSFMYYLRQYGYVSHLRIMMLPGEPVEVYSIFRNDERGRRLASLFDRANREGTRDGVFDSITEEFMSTGTPANGE